MRSILLAGGLLGLLAGCSARTARFVRYRLGGTPPAAVVCRDEGAARWCLHEPPGPRSDDLVYFLHYATGDERSWDRLGISRAFYDEYRRLGRPAPRAITISFGGHWLLTARAGVRQTVALAEFDALRRRIEASLKPVRERYVWGMSQGGFNASALALSDPGPWDGVVLSCPAIYHESPYSPPETAKYAREVEGRLLFTHRLASEQQWLVENPIARARRTASPPPVWIESNREDEFGFAAGAEALAHAWRGAYLLVSPGGHCVIDARAAARFFADLPDRRL